MPSLRERPEDIPILGRQILQGFASDLGRRGLQLSPEAERALCGYSWPGNVRELRNVLERALLLCGRDVLEPGDLRFEGPGAAPLPLETPAAEMHLTLEELEKVHIRPSCTRWEGGGGRQRLGIPRSTLYQKIKRFAISLPRTP
jgi:DNA-binding NtrC family response regulator